MVTETPVRTAISDITQRRRDVMMVYMHRSSASWSIRAIDEGISSERVGGSDEVNPTKRVADSSTLSIITFWS